MRTKKHLWPLWRRILTGLSSLALFLSAVISWHYLTGGSMAGCGGGSPCENVLTSRWSVIAGILPVSGLAMGVYLAVLVAGLFIGPASETPVRRMAWKVMLILGGAVAGSAVWFTILQKWVIGDFCPWCMSAHITGLLLSVLIFRRAITEPDDKTATPVIRFLPAMGLTLGGLILAGILAAGQAVLTPATAYSDGGSQAGLPAMDYESVPVAGSPDAPYIVTLLYDYQCSHCQKIHFMLNEAMVKYAGKLSFVLCPAPLNTRCNPYVPRDADEFRNSCELAETGLAVWLAKREAFPGFQNWMFTFESGDRWRPRDPGAARAKAMELVGQAGFNAALSNPWVGQYLQTSVRIYGQTIRNGRGGIPKLIFGSRWVIPGSYSLNDFMVILQKSLGVPAP